MDKEYYAEVLARMVRCKTVSVKGQSAGQPFSDMKAVMRELFPHVFSSVISRRTWSATAHGLTQVLLWGFLQKVWEEK